jgi:ATP-dependent helicase/nuclease subunit A
MTAAIELPDLQARETAIDPERSCIVQAPAGSGKTELLIQRFLRLISVVDAPEEVVAITFTRKAAGEMRERIEGALRAAQAGNVPQEAHRKKGYRLACAALDRDRELGWGLMEHPNRLRISTIDSINASLARRAPLTAGVTSLNPVVDDCTPYYRNAIHETLLLAAEESDAGRCVTALLGHCDNRSDLAERHLLLMLKRRDQWLRHTSSGQSVTAEERRTFIESSLQMLIETFLHVVHNAVPDTEHDNLVSLLCYAGESIADEKPESPLTGWGDRTGLPAPTIENIDLWRSMAACLLKKNGGQWRAQVNKNDGFPPGSDARKLRKQQMTELLGRLVGHESFRRALADVQELPDAHFTDAQWALIDALWQVLPLTVAILKSIFAERGVTDYTEVAQEAVAALGVGDETTDLRLSLDYQIKHILLDEFQDTSLSQVLLIRRLTDGWESEAARSLFLVGDPMQSIYRFREAEVSLFLDAWNDGIGGLALEPLRLEANFRSDPEIVKWFNDTFDKIFPEENDPAMGAVKFERSIAMLPGQFQNCVNWHPLPGGEFTLEAEQIAGIVAESLAENETNTIGILVRSRKHAFEIGRQLRESNIPFTATGLENLDEQSAVQDLVALTRALLHPGDRIAWLACLRAPWCGLRLADLHTLAAHDHDRCIWTLMNDTANVARLTPGGKKRLERCRGIFAAALERFGTVPLRDQIESVWLQLGGPATLGANQRIGNELSSDDASFEAEVVNDLIMTEQFFDLLDTFAANVNDESELLRLLADKSITRGGDGDRVFIMTIHKAKGLEFDTVILPGLSRRTRQSDKPPLLFHEFDTADNSQGLVVAPIAGGDQDKDPIHELLWRFERERERFERDRLMYVAITRAKKQLHLFAGLTAMDQDDPTPKEPPADSLLGRLWPVAGDAVLQALVEYEKAQGKPLSLPVKENNTGENRQYDLQSVRIYRLPDEWRRPDTEEPCGVITLQEDKDEAKEVEFDWASPWVKHVGSVVHRWLQQIAEEGIALWNTGRVRDAVPALRLALSRAGVGREHIDTALARTIEALCNALEDQNGQWTLGTHSEAKNELPITTLDPDTGTFQLNIIDRTFVSDDGTRWIIDYKTGTHESTDVADFLRSEEERYRPQLRRYRDAFRKLEDRPIRTALYFPLLKALHIVECDDL